MNTLSTAERAQTFTKLYDASGALLQRTDVQEGLKPLGANYEEVHSRFFLPDFEGRYIDDTDPPNSDGVPLVPITRHEGIGGVFIESHRLLWPTTTRHTVTAQHFLRKHIDISDDEMRELLTGFALNGIEEHCTEQPLYLPFMWGSAFTLITQRQKSIDEPMFSTRPRIYIAAEDGREKPITTLHEAVHADDLDRRESCIEDESTYRFSAFTELRAWHMSKLCMLAYGIEPDERIAQLDHIKEKAGIVGPESPAEVDDQVIIALAHLGILGPTESLILDKLPDGHGIEHKTLEQKLAEFNAKHDLR